MGTSETGTRSSERKFAIVKRNMPLTKFFSWQEHLRYLIKKRITVSLKDWPNSTTI